MRQRGETLAARALEVWSSPQLSEEQRQAYRQPSRRQLAGYTLTDHPQLANPQIRAVFDLLDARIRALDPNVSQEVLKLTIAYKAETNFVDIVPQAKRLRLSLNMPFAELDDPRGIAKNVAGIGRWGNGEVEFGVSSLEEVPYALGLIRQSLERQQPPPPLQPAQSIRGSAPWQPASQQPSRRPRCGCSDPAPGALPGPTPTWIC
jgi:predicted transport protein